MFQHALRYTFHMTDSDGESMSVGIWLLFSILFQDPFLSFLMSIDSIFLTMGVFSGNQNPPRQLYLTDKLSSQSTSWHRITLKEALLKCLQTNSKWVHSFSVSLILFHSKLIRTLAWWLLNFLVFWSQFWDLWSCYETSTLLLLHSLSTYISIQISSMQTFQSSIRSQFGATDKKQKQSCSYEINDLL